MQTGCHVLIQVESLLSYVIRSSSAGPELVEGSLSKDEQAIQFMVRQAHHERCIK